MKPSLFDSGAVANKLYERNFFEKKLPALLPRIDDLEERFRDCRKLFQAHPDLDNYFEFRIAEEALEYISAKTGDGRIEGYFDAYDLQNLKQAKGQPAPLALRNLAKGSFYLVSAQQQAPGLRGPARSIGRRAWRRLIRGNEPS